MSDRQTTVIDQSRPAGKQVVSRILVALRRTFIATEHVENAQQLADRLNAMQDDLHGATLGARQNPWTTPCIVRSVQPAANSTIVLTHTLGRPVTGWFCCRARGVAFTGFEPPISSWPAGTTPSKQHVISYTGAGGGTFDFCLSGE